MNGSPSTSFEPPLASAADVIDALGGTEGVMALTGAKSSQVVSYWRTSGRFPPKLFLLMTGALAATGKSASPALWNQALSAEAAE